MLGVFLAEIQKCHVCSKKNQSFPWNIQPVASYKRRVWDMSFLFPKLKNRKEIFPIPKRRKREVEIEWEVMVFGKSRTAIGEPRVESGGNVSNQVPFLSLSPFFFLSLQLDDMHLKTIKKKKEGLAVLSISGILNDMQFFSQNTNFRWNEAICWTKSLGALFHFSWMEMKWNSHLWLSWLIGLTFSWQSHLGLDDHSHLLMKRNINDKRYCLNFAEIE